MPENSPPSSSTPPAMPSAALAITAAVEPEPKHLADAQNSVAVREWMRDYRTLVAASAASICSVLVGSPFDTVKVRMQTQRFTSTTECVKQIWRNEGTRGFFRGILPPLLTVNLVKTVSVGVYEKSRAELAAWQGRRPGTFVFFTAGFLAGTSTAFMSCPLELIRNQRIMHDAHVQARNLASSATTSARQMSTMTAHSVSSGIASAPSGNLAPHNNHHATSVSSAIRKTSSWEYARVLVQNHGLTGGLYRGFHLHFLRESLGTGIYWLSYESLHRLPFISPTGRRQDASAFGHFLAGGLTGIIAWILIFPIDLVKNVYQKDASVQGKLRYNGPLHCVRSIYRRNGLSGFYFGLRPTMWRAFPIHSINLVIYEYFLKLLE